LFLSVSTLVFSQEKPNIVLILTDDQGYADLGCHGNPYLKTPNIDRFAQESVEFSQFYVSPVCAPTRASLMTGRYSYRTKVTDTWFGRSLMHQDEVTIAEVLKKNGYTTGIFGKWHLGDNYPRRPQDQGFDEAIIHRGGGITQPSCPPENSYFDPLLLHNGEMKKYKGYCMDVYTDEAIKFIRNHKTQPFFVYLATNTPHDPLQVSDEYVDPYRRLGLDDKTARVYGMVANIDDNFRKLLAAVDQMGLASNTIVIFMSDNGPTQEGVGRYTAGLRGHKTQVYEGGIRVPFFIRWPDRFRPGRKIDRLAAHIDVMPTLLELCDAAKPQDVQFDGLSLAPLLQEDSPAWADRTLFFQWHRGDSPELYRSVAARNDRYKLVQAQNLFDGNRPLEFELFDIQNDPEEKKNIALQHPEMVAQLKSEYKDWLTDVSRTRGFSPSLVWLGTPYENPVVMTQEDRRDADGWGNDKFTEDAHWPVKVVRGGNYEIKLRLYYPAISDGIAFFKLGDIQMEHLIVKGATEYAFTGVHLSQGEGKLKGWVQFGTHKIGLRFMDVKLLDK
jgi:arylsulfatase A-like enzyme